MKYVIAMIEGCESPIIFPDYVVHKHFEHLNVRSAGYCSIGDDRSVSVWGESIGLKKKCDPMDKYWIERLIRNE